MNFLQYIIFIAYKSV